MSKKRTTSSSASTCHLQLPPSSSSHPPSCSSTGAQQFSSRSQNNSCSSKSVSTTRVSAYRSSSGSDAFLSAIVVPGTCADSSNDDKDTNNKNNSNKWALVVQSAANNKRNNNNNNNNAKEDKSFGIERNRSSCRMNTEAQSSTQTSVMMDSTSSLIHMKGNKDIQQQQGTTIMLRERKKPNEHQTYEAKKKELDRLQQQTLTFSWFGLRKFELISCAIVLVAFCLLLVAPQLIVASATITTISGPASSSSGGQSIKILSATTAAASAYGDPIKWSFGGWAPLDGAKNGTNLKAMNEQQSRQQQYAGTSPLPVSGPTARPTSGSHNHTSRAVGSLRPKLDLLKESASSYQEKVQYTAAAAAAAQRHMVDQSANNNQQMSAYNHQQSSPQHHKLQPAYALPLQRVPPAMEFSQPAPAPIVRAHVLPQQQQQMFNHNKQHAQAMMMNHTRPPFPMPNGAGNGAGGQVMYPQQHHASPHFMVNRQHHHHPAASEHHHQLHHQHMMMQQSPPEGMRQPPNGFYQQQQQQHHHKMMQEHHQRQHQMFQQMFKQRPQQQQQQSYQHHQAPRGMDHQMSAGAPYANGAYSRPPQPVEEIPIRPQSLPHYPGSPPMIHQQPYQATNYQQEQQAKQPHFQHQQPHQQPNSPAISPFKPLEGNQHHQEEEQQQEEHPIAYTNSLADERIPLLEINGPNRNVSEGGIKGGHSHQQQQQPLPELTSTTLAAGAGNGEQIYGSTLGANNENSNNNNNLNYQNGLNQATTYVTPDGQQQRELDHHSNHHQQQQQQSNNIQDIKQRQQYEQQQQQKIVNANENVESQHQQHEKTIANSKPSYLTIPVAVETEGDKVLTPDDINEIEKHVIKVLPNLKTADKIVKMADAHLDLATGQIKATTTAGQQMVQQEQEHEQPQQQVVEAPDLHQIHYNEHRMTLKQLDSDLGKEPQSDYIGHNSPIEPHQLEPNQASTASYQPSSSSSSGGSTNGMAHSPMATTDYDQQRPSTASGQQQYGSSSSASAGPVDSGEHLMNEHDYFVATGPMQEVGTVDGDQMSDYNLIKNDLLNNFRYEPTRAHPASSISSSSSGGGGVATSANGHASRGQPQTASTPPMPYTAHSTADRYRSQSQPGQTNSRETTQFYQSHEHEQQQQPTSRPLRHSFGRMPPTMNNNNNRGNRQMSNKYNGGQSTATTKTIMGGRRVSDVMRPLIHTTPVPMTSPLHVPSVEPEKVDAIQLIAGKANDNQPMVVEPHQLVNHTPDGGFDFNSGAPLPGATPQSSDQRPVHENHDIIGGNDEPSRQQRQYVGSSSTTVKDQQLPSSNGGENDGTVIEYVAMNEPQQQHQQQQQQEQTYEVSGQPEAPVYLAAGNVGGEQEKEINNDNGNVGNTIRVQQQQQPLYDYTMTTQQQQQSSDSQTAADNVEQQADNNHNNNGAQDSAGYNAANQQQQHVEPQQGQQPSLAWSPSIANEHQQQQLELAEHAGPAQGGLEIMPATAGYNFFSQQQEQPPSTTSAKAHEYEQPSNSRQEPEQQHQQQQEREQDQQHDHDEQTKRWRTKAGGSQPNPDAQYDGQMVKGEQEQEQQQQQHVEQEAHSNHPNQEPIDPENQQQQQANYANHQQQTVELSRLTQDSRPQQEDHEHQQQQQQQYDHQQQHNDNEPNSDAYQQQPQHRQAQQQQEQYHQDKQVSHQPTGNSEQQSTGDYNSYNQQQQQQQQSPSNGNYEHQNQQQFPLSTGKYNYMKLDSDRQLAHLAKHQAEHQAQLAELLNTPNNGNNYQTTTPMSLITSPRVQQDTQQQQIQQEQDNGQQQQQQEEEKETTTGGNNGGGYIVEQVQSRPSVQSPPEAMLINESPMQVPISDQQSLISDPNHESNDQFSDDDRAKQHVNGKQPATAVYQVYQAYYAPKDHKPLPGYVRLSLDEFNELFRDAEIQYVDKNMNGLNNMVRQGTTNEQHQAIGYEQQSPMNEMMKASASEQSIVVDRRSITGRTANSTQIVKPTDDATSSDAKSSVSKKAKLGHQGVKKIISIRNSRSQVARQQQQIKVAKLPSSNSTTTSPTTTNMIVSGGLTIVPPPPTTNTPTSAMIVDSAKVSKIIHDLAEEEVVDIVKHPRSNKKKPEVAAQTKQKLPTARATSSGKQSKVVKDPQQQMDSRHPTTIAHSNSGSDKKH